MPITPQAAIMVMDHIPDSEEVEELAAMHLDEFPGVPAFATIDIMYEPPAWLEVGERDQMAAHLRDGAKCVLVIYMQEGPYDEGDDDDDFE